MARPPSGAMPVIGAPAGAASVMRLSRRSVCLAASTLALAAGADAATLPTDADRDIGRPDHHLTTRDGVRLALWTRGRGTPVLFAPGWTATAPMFVRALRDLSGDHRVIVFDPRGQGRSAKTTAAHDVRARGGDLVEIVNRLDLRGVHLVGWSMGALDVLAAWPAIAGRLARVTLLDQPPVTVGAAGEWVDFDRAALLDTIRAFDGDPRAVRQALAASWLPGADTATLNWLLAEAALTPDAIALQSGFSLIAADLRPALVTLAAAKPVLAISREDRATAAKAWLAANAPGCRFDAFGPHMMFHAEPARFNARLRAFAMDGG
jgi:pimeloyl-ACP methyl ester carboxylesterase